MNQLKALLLVSALISAHASAANIQKGNIEIDGSASLSRAYRHTSFTLNPSAQYFLADHLSLGADTFVNTYTGSPASYGIGPVGTLYFAVSDTVAPFFSLTPIFWSYNSWSGTYYSSTAKLGVKFFLTESVAFGPLVRFTHNYATHYWSDSSNNGALMAVFSIHL